MNGNNFMFVGGGRIIMCNEICLENENDIFIFMQIIK